MATIGPPLCARCGKPNVVEHDTTAADSACRCPRSTDLDVRGLDRPPADKMIRGRQAVRKRRPPDGD